jgi:hypothetical protein
MYALAYATSVRAKMIRKLVGMGVDNADASIITDYVRDRGPHAIPGHPGLVARWVPGCWTIWAPPPR